MLPSPARTTDSKAGELAPPEPRPARDAETKAAAFSAICLVGALLFSAARIGSSLWQDETATYWVVKNGIREVVARSWLWSGQSALYYLTAWAGRHLSTSLGIEVALRLPSLLAMGAALYFIYRLGRRLAGVSVGVVSALALLCVADVSFAAIDARPYALGLALLLASTLCFLEWADHGRALHAALYVLTAALVVYAHYLFAPALVAHAFYDRRRWRGLAGLWIAAAALCAPLAGQVLFFYRTRGAHSFASSPGVDAYFNQIIPPVLAGAVLLALALRRKPDFTSRPLPWTFLLVWLLLPTTGLFLLSVSTDVKLFVARYCLACVPPAAILAAWVIVRCSAVRPASVVLLVSLGLRVLASGDQHGLEDWRGAMQTLHAQAAPGDRILVASGFIEAAGDRLKDPALRDVLFAPQDMYGIRAFDGLPLQFEEKAIPADLGGRRVFLVTRRTTFLGYVVGLQYENALGERLQGYRRRELGPFRGISVVTFER